MIIFDRRKFRLTRQGLGVSRKEIDALVGTQGYCAKLENSYTKTFNLNSLTISCQLIGKTIQDFLFKEKVEIKEEIDQDCLDQERHQ